MWLQWHSLFLSLVLYCLLILHDCQATNDCQMPTEGKEISICSYCSDSYAGVRWAVHPSVDNKYPYGPYILVIEFHCKNTQNMVSITQDACFNGAGLPVLTSLRDPSAWRWHILGQMLPEGTECQFTSKVKNGYFLEIDRLRMNTSCKIGDNDDGRTVIPATCSDSESIPQECPCRCSEGFWSSSGEVLDSLTCDCVDRGGHHTDCATTTPGPEPTSTITESISSIEISPSTLTLVAPSFTTSNNAEITTAFTNEPSTTVTDVPVIKGTQKSISNAEITTAFTNEPSTTVTGTEITTAFTNEPSATVTDVPVIKGTQKSINGITLGITVGIILLIVFVAVVVVISVSITRKNPYLQTKKLKMMTIPQELAKDPFDPDFSPVNIEKSDSISVGTVSLKSIFDPLDYDGHNALSASGSVITLNIDEIMDF